MIITQFTKRNFLLALIHDYMNTEWVSNDQLKTGKSLYENPMNPQELFTIPLNSKRIFKEIMLNYGITISWTK